MIRRVFSAFAIFLLSLITAQACGPDFFPDVFVRKLRPDVPKDFAAGKLGILLASYPRAHLAVAYRYLNGGTLSAEEQAGYQPLDTYLEELRQDEEKISKSYWNQQEAAEKLAHQPIEDWRTERAKYADPQPAVEQDRESKVKGPDGNTYGADYQNCSVDAFHKATETLKGRAQAWGAKSPELADWLRGQDAVFANCHGGSVVEPAAPPATAPLLLKQDRAYQIASARFYAADFAGAQRDFKAIAQDKSSPWSGLAAYLEARCLVRQAFLANGVGSSDGMASFDPAMMRQAAALLRTLLKENPAGVSRRAVESLLDLVRLRIEPEARLHELSAALAGPATDANYSQHLKDLTWYLNAKLDNQPIREDLPSYYLPKSPAPFSDAYKSVADLRKAAPLVDWLITFQSPAPEAAAHALAEWQSSRSLPWLVAALVKAQGREEAVPELLEATAQFPANSPAWETVTYHRLRLLLAQGRAAEARAALAEAMPAIKAGGRDSSINAFLGLRMTAASEMSEFLAYAPRKLLAAESEAAASQRECVEVMKNPKRVYDCSRQIGPLQFAPDAAAVLNAQTPLSTLATIAASAQLPAELSRSVAMVGWTRAVLLHDDAAAARFFPHLPAKLQQQAGAGTGFHALMTLARNPGLRPFLDEGVQRLDSYDFVESYRDNWWCSNSGTSDSSNNAAALLAPAASFLTPESRAEAARQVAALKARGHADLDLGGQILDDVRSHPADPDAAESLYLVLRMIRYSCGDMDDSPAGQQKAKVIDGIRDTAARLLRQRYSTSPWTKKAAPYVH
jgi:hypothetical protein